MFQIKMNKLRELPEFNFPKRYAYYILQLLTVCFYGYILPIASLFTVVFLIIQYQIDKANLVCGCRVGRSEEDSCGNHGCAFFEGSCVKHNLSFAFTKLIFKITDFCVFVLSMGSVFFSYKIRGKISFQLWIGLGVSIIFISLNLFSRYVPIRFERLCWISKILFENRSYEDCEKIGKF